MQISTSPSQRILTSSSPPPLCSFLPLQLAGNLARLPSDELNRMATLFLFSRVLYNFAYIYLEGFWPSLGRTAVFQVGIIAGLRLIFLAGNKLQ